MKIIYSILISLMLVFAFVISFAFAAILIVHSGVLALFIVTTIVLFNRKK